MNREPITNNNKPTTSNQPYAYLGHWTNQRDVRFLGQLLLQGVKVRVADKAFEAEGEQYAPGTLIITRTGNERLGPKLDQLVRAQADSAGVAVRAVQSGFSTTGGDLGSSAVRFVKPPAVAVVAGPDIDPHGVRGGVALF